jgi:hypothetical protein
MCEWRKRACGRHVRMNVNARVAVCACMRVHVCGSVLCFQPFARTRESVTVRMHNEKVIGAG